MAHFRSDLIAKFEVTRNPEMFINYLYHINSLSPAPGEDAFQMLKIPFAWAKLPLIERFEKLDESLPVSFIYGENTWMVKASSYQLQQKYYNRKIDIYEIKNAGHHVMLDNAYDFNTTMEYVSKKFTNLFEKSICII